MPRKKNPDAPGRGSNRKVPVHVFEPVLHEMLRIATRNHFVLPKKCSMTLKDIKQRFGQPAVDKFKHWFECSRKFDQDKADVIRSKLLRGEFDKPPASWKKDAIEYYTPEKYADWREARTCFSPIWSVKAELWRDAYKLCQINHA